MHSLWEASRSFSPGLTWPPGKANCPEWYLSVFREALFMRRNSIRCGGGSWRFYSAWYLVYYLHIFTRSSGLSINVVILLNQGLTLKIKHTEVYIVPVFCGIKNGEYWENILETWINPMASDRMFFRFIVFIKQERLWL